MPNLLKDFPFEIRKAVLLKQAELKAERNQGKCSQKHALIQIIREWAQSKASTTRHS